MRRRLPRATPMALLSLCLRLLCLLGGVPSPAAQPAGETIFWEADHLLRLRTEPEGLSAEVRDSLAQLRAAADEALGRGPYSVMDKQIVPPSGDKHDYMSYSRYWWPNPDTADGLPYVRRDGVVNHKLLSRGDRYRIGAFYDDFEALALGAYLLDEDRYADHAVLLLRTWFLDPDTRMNPNLKYGQAVPGRSEGRAPGVIDTRHFVRVLDGALLLHSIGELEDQPMAELREWFTRFLDWLMTSEIGRKEQQAKNNHGAWYAAQAGGIALFIGKDDLAASIVEEVRDERLAESIAEDGSLPEELARTRSLHYSLFSLSAMAVVARVGERVGVDLWNHEAEGGASLKKALDYAGPYAADVGGWEHEMIEPFRMSDRQSQLFVLAASRWGEPRYLDYVERAPKRYRGRHLTPLLFAAP